MKKILIGVMSLVVVLGLVGGGAFAYFNDTETSTGNTFTAGSLDLQMGIGSTWYDTDFIIAQADDIAPGDVLGAYRVAFKNAGTITGKVRVNVSILGEADVDPEVGEYAGLEKTADEFAQKLVVTEALLQGFTDNKATQWVGTINTFFGGEAAALAAGGIADIGGVKYPTIFGLSKITLYFYVPGVTPLTEVPWAGGDNYYEDFTIVFDSSADNPYQFDGVEIGFTGTIVQYDQP